MVGGGCGVGPARVRSVAPTAECCSSTSARRSASASWRRCELRWRTARSGWPVATAWRGTRPGSSSSWRPIRVRAHQPIPVTASARRSAKRRYLGKLSGPLLDRVDLRVEMHPIRSGAFTTEDGEATATVRDRVAAARQAAAERVGTRTASAPTPRCSGAAAAPAISAATAGDDAAAHRTRPWRVEHPGRRPHAARSRGRCATWRVDESPSLDDVADRAELPTGGR